MRLSLSFLSVVSLVFLAYVLGQYAAWRKAYPFEPHFREAFIGLEALAFVYYSESQPFMSDVWMPEAQRPGDSGVTAHDPRRAFEGYTLLAVGQSAVLIDMAGQVVHRWHVPYRDLIDAQAKVPASPAEPRLFWKPVRLLPGGDLLAVVDVTDATPYGLAVVKLDRDSNVLWVHHRYVHHDFDVGNDGRIYVLDQNIRNDGLRDLPAIVPPFLDEGVVVLSPEGELMKRVSIVEAFANSPYKGMLDRLATRNDRRWGDYLHSNNVDVIEDEAVPGSQVFRRGRVILSFREISTIAVLDLDQESIVWAARGPWQSQHDPDLLADGDMMLFDNRGDWRRGGKSRILRFDPESMEILWRYPANDDGRLWSPLRAEQQRLPNGNVFINEFASGRLLEVNQAGDLVWEYFCNFRNEQNEEYICRVVYAERYAPSDIDFQVRHQQRAGTD